MMNMKATGVLCEGCRAAESAVYCRVDAAYLCVSCDSRIHITALHHDRVRLCASCSYAPAVVLCKADSASLCIACDHKIHSANLLAARHHRVPIQPMTDAIPGPPRHTFTGSNIPESSDGGAMENDADEDDEEEAASWLLLNPPNGKANRNDGLRFGEFLELADFGSSPNLDQCNKEESNQKQEYNVHQRQFFQLGMKYEDPKAVDFVPASSFYSTPSMAPDTATQGSFSQTKQLRDDASDPFPGCAVDREARVLRYREKKKSRRFEKTIRYASRKAYAEVRPRIKGRFVKQADG